MCNILLILSEITVWLLGFIFISIWTLWILHPFEPFLRRICSNSNEKNPRFFTKELIWSRTRCSLHAVYPVRQPITEVTTMLWQLVGYGRSVVEIWFLGWQRVPFDRYDVHTRGSSAVVITATGACGVAVEQFWADERGDMKLDRWIRTEIAL